MGSEDMNAKPTVPLCTLPRIEILLYFVTWTALSLRTFYAVWRASDDYKYHVLYNLKDGWAALAQKQDVSDGEWRQWCNAMYNGFYVWLIGHVLLSIVLTKLSASNVVRSVLFTIYSMLSVINTDGWRSLLLILVHCSLLCIVARLSRSMLCVWFLSAALLLTLNIPFTYYYLVDLLGLDSMIAEYGIAMSLLRSTSAALTICSDVASTQSVMSCSQPHVNSDHCASHVPADYHQTYRQSQQTSVHSTAEQPTATTTTTTTTTTTAHQSSSHLLYIADVLCFIFYLPLFYAGPLMVFDEFRKQLKRPVPLSLDQLSAISFLAARVVVWTVALSVALHYFYATALLQNPFVVQSMSLWAVAGIGYVHGQFFMVKYFVFWAGFGVLARLDGLDPPGPPACISRVYRYSRMWKVFDRGLYMFMSRHIYIPLGGSRHGLPRQLFASFMCFAFVCLWHGIWTHIIVWMILNYIGVTVEAVADRLGRSQLINELESRYLSAEMKQRLHCVLTVPLCAMSHFAIFTFFAGSDVGFIIFYRLIVEGFPSSFLLVCLCEYLFCNLSKFMDSIEQSRTAVNKKL